MFGQFEQHFDLKVKLNAKEKKEIKLAMLDTTTNSFGFIVTTCKKLIKDATIKAMEEMRFLTRARNADDMFAIATNLYEWQFIYYSRRDELAGEKSFFSHS